MFYFMKIVLKMVLTTNTKNLSIMSMEYNLNKLENTKKKIRRRRCITAKKLSIGFCIHANYLFIIHCSLFVHLLPRF